MNSHCFVPEKIGRRSVQTSGGHVRAGRWPQKGKWRERWDDFVGISAEWKCSVERGIQRGLLLASPLRFLLGLSLSRSRCWSDRRCPSDHVYLRSRDVHSDSLWPVAFPFYIWENWALEKLMNRLWVLRPVVTAKEVTAGSSLSKTFHVGPASHSRELVLQAGRGSCSHFPLSFCVGGFVRRPALQPSQEWQSLQTVP